MPRFDNEGFNPKKRINNDKRDRTVPDDSSFYPNVDLNFNSREKDDSQNTYPYGTGESENTQYDNLLPPEPPVYDRQQNDYGYGDNSSYYAQNSRPSQRNTQRNTHKNAQNDFRRPQAQKSRSAQPNGSRAKKKNRTSPKRKRFKAAKLIPVIILILIAAIVLSGFAMVNGVLGKINYDDKTANQYVESSQLTSDSQIKNILLLGTDARAGQDSETSRADSMMIVSVDTKHKCIKTVSFLRDTWVYIPCRGGKQRLNAACSSGGYSAVVDTIEYNFGVDIDGYVVADFEMFEVLVDSIGGVEIDVTEKEAKEVTSHPKRYGNVTLESGKHVLSGKQALAYCRIRKIDTDFVRTKRQRTVIDSIINKAKSTNPLTLYKMALSSAPYIETDLTKSELKKIALSAVGCLKNDMVQDKVPFEGTWQYETISGNSVITIDVDENKTKLIDFIYNKTYEQIVSEQAQDE